MGTNVQFLLRKKLALTEECTFYITYEPHNLFAMIAVDPEPEPCRLGPLPHRLKSDLHWSTRKTINAGLMAQQC